MPPSTMEIFGRFELMTESGVMLRIDVEGLAAPVGDAGKRPGFGLLRHLGNGCGLQRPVRRDDDRGLLPGIGLLRSLRRLAVEDL